MSKIVFFSIPAYGHTNPTIEVVRELVQRGHEVWYYSFDPFKEIIEAAGATFISCDEYLPELRPEDEKKLGKDFAALIEMVVDTTININTRLYEDLQSFRPNCIVSDSIAFWGKLFAIKLNIPFICSTTTFAFNEHTAKLLNKGFMEFFRIIMTIPRINKKMEQLRENGFEVKNFISIIQNDNETNTIVYTSKDFQPMAETFSNKYHFVGPSIKEFSDNIQNVQSAKKTIYISLGTVLNRNKKFYKNCITALKEFNANIIMSVGEKTDIPSLGKIPTNFSVNTKVEQIKTLEKSDIFLTHSGMNSVNESLYYGVPMVLFPQQGEQRMVADRVTELNAGILLKRNNPQHIKDAILKIFNDDSYKHNAIKLSESMKNSGGAKKAADAILSVANLVNDK